MQADACNPGAAVEADAIERAAVEADAIGEQQPKRTQSGSSSRSGRNQGAAAEADASGDHGAVAEADASGEHAAAAEADANGEQQLKRMQSGPGTAADSKRTQAASSSWQSGGQADAIGEQQLCTESCLAPDYSR